MNTLHLNGKTRFRDLGASPNESSRETLELGLDMYPFRPSALDEGVEGARKRQRRERSLRDAKRVATGKPARQKVDYERFPTHIMPPAVASYIRELAKAIGCDEAMVAVPLVSASSAAIGSAAHLQLKNSWHEPAHVWTAIVAPSGSAKSPAFSQALRPINVLEKDALTQYQKEKIAYEATQDSSAPPIRRRYRIADATTEAILQLLAENPRGLLLNRNELAAWLGGFDRYSKGAADLQCYLELWDGDLASVDRVTKESLTVSNPALAITGTIQPGALKSRLTEAHFESGFAARLLLCLPPVPPQTWSEEDLADETYAEIEDVFQSLYEIPEGSKVKLCPASKKMWASFYNALNQTIQETEEGPVKAVLVKSIRYTARFILQLHLLRWAAGETNTLHTTDEESVLKGIRLGRWFREETCRVYAELGLAEYAVSPRMLFFQGLQDQFTRAEAINEANRAEIPERTADKWLKDLLDSGYLKKPKRGLYQKC